MIMSSVFKRVIIWGGIFLLCSCNLFDFNCGDSETKDFTTPTFVFDLNISNRGKSSGEHFIFESTPSYASNDKGNIIKKNTSITINLGEKQDPPIIRCEADDTLDISCHYNLENNEDGWVITKINTTVTGLNFNHTFSKIGDIDTTIKVPQLSSGNYPVKIKIDYKARSKSAEANCEGDLEDIFAYINL